MKLTPSQAQSFASLLGRYIDESVRISTVEGTRSIQVAFSSGDNFIVGGRGTIKDA
jgi:hypothetical protein